MTLESKTKILEVLIGALTTFVNDCIAYKGDISNIETIRMIDSKLQESFKTLNGMPLGDIILSFCMLDDTMDYMKSKLIENIAVVTGLDKKVADN